MTAPQKRPQTGETGRSAPPVADRGGNRPHGASDAPRSNASPNKPHHDAPHFDDGGRFIHYCQHPGCDRWGSHGFDCELTRYARAEKRGAPDADRYLGRWYCAEHARAQVEKKQHNPEPAPAVGGAAKAPRPERPARGSAKGSQGSLF